MSNKYVVPTGEGYLGVATVGDHRSAAFGVGMWPFDWDVGTLLYAVDEAEGVAMFPADAPPREFITTHEVTRKWGSGGGPTVAVSGAVLSVLDVGVGEDLRAYERDAGGITVVGTDPDPFVGVDDGV